MKKILMTGIISLGVLFVGNKVADAELIDTKVDTTYNKYIEEYLVENYEKNTIFTKIYIKSNDIDKVNKVDGNVDCYVFSDDTINHNGEKRTNERPVPVSLWESKFTGKPKVNTEYILVVKRNYFSGGGYLKSFEPIDIIEIEKPKKTFKIKK